MLATRLFAQIALCVALVFTALSPLSAQGPNWANAATAVATPTMPFSNPPAVIDRSQHPVLGLRTLSAAPGSWFTVLPTIRLIEPAATSPEHAQWTQLVTAFPWLNDHHWEPGQTPPSGPAPSTADLLSAVNLGSLVNQGDIDALDIAPFSPDPNALRRLIQDIIAECRHHALPVLDGAQPVTFDPVNQDWISDLYGNGSSSSWAAWLNAAKADYPLDGALTTAINTSRLAEVALTYQAPTSGELSQALREMNTIENVGYEIWMTLVFLSPESALTNPLVYGEPAAVPEIPADAAPDDVRVSLEVSFGVTSDASGVLEAIAPQAKQSGAGPGGQTTLFIPMPLSSVDVLQIEVPLADGSSTSLVANRAPFEPGFMVAIPFATPQLDAITDWPLSYPPVDGWPGFPIADLPNPVALGIIQ